MFLYQITQTISTHPTTSTITGGGVTKMAVVYYNNFPYITKYFGYLHTCFCIIAHHPAGNGED